MSHASCYPSREAFRKLASLGNIVPVYREVIADLETPVSVYYKAFLRPASARSGDASAAAESAGNPAREEDFSCLLESIEGSMKLARYSFIAGEPFLTFMAKGEQVEIKRGGGKELRSGNPFAILREILKEYKAAPTPGLPRFFGGAVGYIGYDSVRFIERLPGGPIDDLALPDMFLIFPGAVIVFDHYSSRIKVIVNARVGEDPEGAYKAALVKIDEIVGRVRSGQAVEDVLRPREPRQVLKEGRIESHPFGSNMNREEFMGKVLKIKDYIRRGDTFQTVLSQRFVSQLDASPFEVYRALRSLNPSPYMYYLNFGRVRIAGASPEVLVRLEGGTVETRPIAGTRPRGKSAEEDQALEKELLADEKERAEHVMLVDLGRNDLGKVSRYGSVQVPTFMSCERYSHVMHIVSEVRGQIREDKDALDALMACFPAGTVSGAPKVRAMEIIDELEPTRRGPYAGAVGYISLSGDMDMCITIRTFVFADGQAYVQAGAGIVADSDPGREYEETLNKARALFEALRIAREGLE